MIEKLWYEKNRAIWLNGIFLLLIPFSLLYGGISAIRRIFYQRKLLKSWQAPIPIVVVGNLSVGGNGKTPLVVALIESFKMRGLRVGVVSRGYGGKSDHYPLVLDDNTTCDKAGDEPVLIYQRTKVPLAVAPNRVDAVKALMERAELDLILTDDGLQHYALARDIEITVVDGKRQFGNGWFMPAGPMRERPCRLKTVDLIIINGETTIDRLEQYSAKTYTMQLQPQQVINLVTQEKKSLFELHAICAIAGISNPNRFFSMLTELNADIVKTQGFADHQPFSADLLANIASPQQNLLMTEKDAVKCRQFAKTNWWYLPIEANLPVDAIDHLYALLPTQSAIKDKNSKRDT